MREEKIKLLYKNCLKNLNCINNDMPKLVMGNGNFYAKLIMIGEAPGAKEEKLGKPFVGQAGKNLNHFLEVVGIYRSCLYITNVVKYRPYKISPKTGNKINRTPNKKEIDYFRNYLHKEIEIINPEFIVTLGNTALKGITDKKLIIGNSHGTLININILNKDYRVVPLYHPASVIYKRELVKIYEEDLIKLREYLVLMGEYNEYTYC